MKTLTRREAIYQTCLNCGDGSAKDIKNCDRTACKLFPFKDRKGKHDAALRNRAIREMCLWCMGSTKHSAGHVRECEDKGCPLFTFRLGHRDTKGTDMAVE